MPWYWWSGTARSPSTTAAAETLKTDAGPDTDKADVAANDASSTANLLLRLSKQPDEDAATAAMAVSTLDLAILTFNCAKNLIDVAPFSAQLHAALASSAGSGADGGLPDLVVL